MACFPHPLLGTPRRRFAVAASLIGNRSADARVRVSRVLAVGGRDKRAMDGARPRQDMDEHGVLARPRSDERRVEEECVSTRRTRGWPTYTNKNTEILQVTTN